MAAESRFQKSIERTLDSLGYWYVKYWGGGKYTKSGVPDILACANGMLMGIELKAPNGRPSIIQLKTLERMRKSGAYGILLYPAMCTTEFIGFIENPTKYDKWYTDNIKIQEEWLQKLLKEE